MRDEAIKAQRERRGAAHAQPAAPIETSTQRMPLTDRSLTRQYSYLNIYITLRYFFSFVWLALKWNYETQKCNMFLIFYILKYS